MKDKNKAVRMLFVPVLGEPYVAIWLNQAASVTS